MPIVTMTNAQNSKNDEFYTQWGEIEQEINSYLEHNPNIFKDKIILLPCDDPEWSNFTKYFAQNFERFGLKKLISTSFAQESKAYKTSYQPSLFESNSPKFDYDKTKIKGKIFTLTRNPTGNGKVDVNDLEWSYLDGDGDFRSDEVTKLRDGSDIIITNPPFSLFIDFLSWVADTDKAFILIGNMNAISYKETFPLIQSGKLWLGVTNFNKGTYFRVPNEFIYAESYQHDRERCGVKVNRVAGVCWFTNIDHGRRHQPLPLMTKQNNLRFNTKILCKNPYEPYDNYEAIEVPYVDSIPSDYVGIMGVPITFLDKFCPEQFEIIWQASGNTRASAPKEILNLVGYVPHTKDKGGGALLNGLMKFGRILIRHKRDVDENNT